MSKNLSTEEFIKRSKEIHGDRYDYSKVVYKNYNTKVKIICNKCGREFEQAVSDHLSGKGCFCNRGNKRRMSLSEWIDKANKIHNNKYDYSLITNYQRGKDYVNVICHELDDFGNEHGVFKVRCENHLYDKNGCPKCAYKKRPLNHKIQFDTFVKRAKEIHGNKYEYVKETFRNTIEKVKIICPIHGEFEQMVKAHLNGQGCPKCKESKLEKEIRLFLDKHNIEYIQQMRNFEWLNINKQHSQSLDFYLPNYNVAIECQGEQHFKPIDFANRGESWSNEMLSKVKLLDNRKKMLCEQNNVKLLYYSNIQYNEDIITDKEKLLEEIGYNYDRYGTSAN